MNSQERVARNAALAVVGIAVAGLVRFIFAYAGGIVGSTEGLGEVSVLLAVATFASIPAGAIGAATNRYYAVAEGGKDSDALAQTIAATLRYTILAVAVAVVATGSYLWIREDLLIVNRAGQTLALVLAATYSMYLIAKAVLFGSGKVREYAVREIVGFAAFLAAGVFALAAADGLEWLLLAMIGWTIPVAIAYLRYVPNKRDRSAPTPHDYLPFAALTTAGTLLSLGLSQVVVLVALWSHGSAGAGLLAAGLALVGPLFLLPRAVSLALTPSLSFKVGMGVANRANRETVVTTKLMLSVASAATTVVLAASPWLLGLIGPEFAEAESSAKLLLLAGFASIVGIPTINRYAAEGSRHLRVTLLGAAVGALAAIVVWLATGELAFEWVAAGYLLANILKVVVPIVLAPRFLGLSQKWSPTDAALVILPVGVAATHGLVQASTILVTLLTAAVVVARILRPKTIIHDPA